MSEAFYARAKVYDLMFPSGGPAADFYRAEAHRPGGSVLELGCGTGHKLIPIASDGYPCVGLDSSPHMLAEARRKADERGVAVEWVHGNMRDFDVGRTFDFVFIAANSLLHLHDAQDLVSCFRSVRRHLAPSARFAFDVFNPSLRLLTEAVGVRRTRESLSFTDPDRGDVRVDVTETYDAGAQVTRGTWHLSTDWSPTSWSCRSRSGASSRKSCRCSSRSADFGSSNASATGPVDRSPGMRRSSSASANRAEEMSPAVPPAQVIVEERSYRCPGRSCDVRACDCATGEPTRLCSSRRSALALHSGGAGGWRTRIVRGTGHRGMGVPVRSG